jgi:hypothetical protein
MLGMKTLFQDGGLLECNNLYVSRYLSVSIFDQFSRRHIAEYRSIVLTLVIITHFT